ncbi:unnamed protein product [Prunus brigantina]
MAVSKAMTVLSLSSLLVCAIFLGEEVEGLRIGYGALSRDDIPGCSFMHPENCYKMKINPYQRGCETEERCRNSLSYRKNP